MAQLIEFMGNQWILVSILMVLLTLFLYTESLKKAQGVTVQRVTMLINRDGAIVLDVRDKQDFTDGHIVDAINIPYTELAARNGELEKFKDKPIVVVCKMGQHSGLASQILKSAGYDNVSRLVGGIGEWRNSNLPLVKS